MGSLQGSRLPLIGEPSSSKGEPFRCTLRSLFTPFTPFPAQARHGGSTVTPARTPGMTGRGGSHLGSAHSCSRIEFVLPKPLWVDSSSNRSVSGNRAHVLGDLRRCTSHLSCFLPGCSHRLTVRLGTPSSLATMWAENDLLRSEPLWACSRLENPDSSRSGIALCQMDCATLPEAFTHPVSLGDAGQVTSRSLHSPAAFDRPSRLGAQTNRRLHLSNLFRLAKATEFF